MAPFIFKIPPLGFQEIQKIISGDLNSDGNDHFGFAVAVDGNYAIVGAKLGETGTGVANPGTAYIFEKTGGVWNKIKTLQAPVPTVSDEFGGAVAISGGVAVVGALGQSPGGVADAGAAFVFEAPTWGLVKELNASDKSPNDFMGSGVAVEGNTIVVGITNKFIGGTNYGSAYIYEKTTSWPATETTKLIASNQAASDNFGWSVAIDNDIIVVGSRTSDPDGIASAGSAYIFEKAGTWPATETKLIKPSNPEILAEFGWSVDISGNTVVVGSWYQDNGGLTDAGIVYVYEKNGTWPTTETAQLKASNAGASDHFGVSITVSGNVIVVGAEDNDSVANNAGIAYVYRKGGTWPTTESEILTASDGTSNDRFGSGVSYDGSTLMVGAKQAPSTDGNNGAVYIF